MSRLPRGKIQEAYFARTPPFAGGRKKTGRRAQGLRYERMVHEHFSIEYDCYLPSPWIRYLDEEGWHWCQPDAVYFDFSAGVITIVEVKYQHTYAAWEQLCELYRPVLAAMFPRELWRFRHLEVVRWYDPDIKWPETPKLIARPFNSDFNYGVHIWKP